MENLRIKVFGVLTEIVGGAEVLIPRKKMGVSELIEYLKEEYPAMALVQCKLAINQKIATDGECSSGDQLVLMPPYSGG